MSLSTREKCRRLVTSGVTPAEAASRYGVRPGTVRQWAKRGRWQHRKVAESVTQAVPQEAPKPIKLHLWMRSLHHESAHLVDKEGATKCGAKVPYGMRWFPGEDTKKCTRCMGHASE